MSSVYHRAVNYYDVVHPLNTCTRATIIAERNLVETVIGRQSTVYMPITQGHIVQVSSQLQFYPKPKRQNIIRRMFPMLIN